MRVRERRDVRAITKLALFEAPTSRLSLVNVVSRIKYHSPIRAQIRERPARTRVIELVPSKGWRMVYQKLRHDVLLKVRYLKDIREATAGEDDLLARALWVEDGAVGVDLRRTNGSDEGAAGGEGGVKARAADGFGS